MFTFQTLERAIRMFCMGFYLETSCDNLMDEEHGFHALKIKLTSGILS